MGDTRVEGETGAVVESSLGEEAVELDDKDGERGTGGLLLSSVEPPDESDSFLASGVDDLKSSPPPPPRPLQRGDSFVGRPQTTMSTSLETKSRPVKHEP